MSPIRQRALVRELKQSLNRLPRLGSPQPPNTPQTWSPSGVITPPYVPIPPITSVPAVKVELIPTTRLSLTNTKNTGNFDTGDIDMVTQEQEDDRQSEQVEVDKEYEQLSDLETVEHIKKRLRDELLHFQQDHGQTNPKRIRLSAHDLIPLARNKLIDTVLFLHGSNIIVEPDSEIIGDDIRCDA